MKKLEPIQPLFRYFGGKRKIAPIVWKIFGEVNHYIEPFAGSSAVFLAQTAKPNFSTINDINGFLVNLFRAIKTNPELLIEESHYPVTQIDMFARHIYIKNNYIELENKLKADESYCDYKIAGYWLYGIVNWIGGGWATIDQPSISYRIPSVGDAPYKYQRSSKLEKLWWLSQIQDRFESTRILCTDFEQCLNTSVTERQNNTAIFLDPPYDSEGHCKDIYARADNNVSSRVREWCSNNTHLKIILCGYGNEHDTLNWETYSWRGASGMSGLAGAGRAHNGRKEKLWLSPSLSATQPKLFLV